MGEKGKGYKDDPRIAAILDILDRYNKGDFSVRGEISKQGDEIDNITLGLNSLAEQSQSTKKVTQQYLDRVERVMEVLLKYTMMDFSETLEISGEGDEIDAIAVGLNTLAEELQASRRQEALQLQTISESKEQIETIISNAPSSVIVMDQEGKIITWNAKAVEVFGWTFEEVRDKPLHDYIIPEKYVKAHKTGMEHFLRSGEGPILNKLVEFIALRKNGNEFPIEMAVSAVQSKGKYIFIAFIIDISTRKAAELQLLAANKQLEESNSELEAFTYSVSHDLRAPLRALNGYSQLLVDRCSGQISEQAKSYINSIAANTKRMGRLIDDLLSLSRYSRAEVERKDVDMNQVVATVLEELAGSADLSNVKINVAELPHANADPALVTQVYGNLIANAVKYSSQKPKPVIDIGSEKSKGETVYYVKDNGSGFDMQFYDKLFGVFQRLHDSSEYEGTGVGLAIVKRVITKHGGKVWADSKLEHGSSFYFTLK